MLFTVLLNFFLSLFLTPSSTAPASRWIVKTDTSSGQCIESWWASQSGRNEFFVKPLPVEGWYLVSTDEEGLKSLKQLSCVEEIYADQRITQRNTIPNDPSYNNQDDMDLIGMPAAWDIARGGVTSRGDTIVVAIIDDGFQVSHDDLGANIWRNKNEIPNDDIDNDNNGYVDDYFGWNVSTFDDVHPIKKHGTQVAGVIGARGNNSKGISGVNWNVKLMLLSQADFESELIMAYQYILDQRKLYRQTDGAKGAFVVAANLSGGIELAFAKDHPLWCEMYNKLGQEGVLSVCAAPNLAISVDVDGDMPTTCASEYMIGVTNVDLQDQLVGNAGFGEKSIDIGAPGHGTISTAPTNQYLDFPGTSAAAPHVTGAIALIYSTPCSAFLNGIEDNPAGIARKVRDLIFSSGKPNNSLDEITVTGRRLNVAKAMEETLTGNCNATGETPFQITRTYPNPLLEGDEISVEFELLSDTTNLTITLYTVAGAMVREYAIKNIPISQAGLGTVRISTEELAAGIYLLTLRKNKFRETVKLFVH